LRFGVISFTFGKIGRFEAQEDKTSQEWVWNPSSQHKTKIRLYPKRNWLTQIWPASEDRKYAHACVFRLLNTLCMIRKPYADMTKRALTKRDF